MSRPNVNECRVGLPLGEIPAGDVDAALAAAPALGGIVSSLGAGRDSGRYFSAMRRLGAHDLTTARVLEPHFDALAILGQAGVTTGDLTAAGVNPDSTWGVFAARAPGLRAERDGSGWTLTGEKPWCSLGSRLTHALITAGTPEGQRLFAVNLRDERVRGSESPWISRGLAAITSTSLHFDAAPALPIGEPGFYLGRDGFAWGGIAVAAIWAGGVDALAHTVLQSLRAGAERGREPDQIAQVHLGRLTVLRHVIDAVLGDAAAAVDRGDAQGQDGLSLATRVRTVVAEAAEDALTVTGHALGPAPLTGDEEHARRVADLTVYVRQHHAERDLAVIGAMTLERE